MLRLHPTSTTKFNWNFYLKIEIKCWHHDHVINRCWREKNTLLIHHFRFDLPRVAHRIAIKRLKRWVEFVVYWRFFVFFLLFVLNIRVSFKRVQIGAILSCFSCKCVEIQNAHSNTRPKIGSASWSVRCVDFLICFKVFNSGISH